MPIKLNGSTSGYAQVQAAATAANNTLTLPNGNGMLVGQSTTTAPTNGQIPIGNGTDYTPATITAGTGITVTNGAGSVTIAATTGGVTSVNTFTGAVQSVLVAGTAQASTSGTSIPFTGIPSWVKRIIIMFNGVSTNGTGAYQVQIGTGGAATISGYSSSQTQFGGSNQTAGTSNTTGFVFASPGASTNTYSGIMTISNISGNNWVYSSLLNSNGTSFLVAGAGNSPTLSGALDYLRIIGSATGSPSDTFDAGTINIQYE